MARHDRKLSRDTEDQKLGGVCSGLAHYFDLDPLLVRVAFVAALAFGGASIIAYILLWWLLDPAPVGTWSAPTVDTTPTDTTPTDVTPTDVTPTDAAPGRVA